MRTGENIYKRKDGRWEARYCKGRNNNGRIIYGSCYGKTYSEAKAKMEQVKQNIQKNPESFFPKKNIPLFGSVCDEWMQCSHLRLKASTRIKYQTIICNHIKPALGNYLLSEISTTTVGQLGRTLLEKVGLAPKTTKDILVLVHSILEYGAKQYPGTVGNVQIPYPKNPSKEMRVLSRAEQNCLTEFLLTELSPCKFGVLLALWTGIRLGELCALQWKHISIEDQSIRIDTTMQRLQSNDSASATKTSIVLSSPKTASSTRTIPMLDYVATLCHRMAPDDQNAYVLTGTRKHMEPRLLQYHFRRYVQACGLEDVTFHTLRHTFATRCVEVDFEIKSLSEILGHSNTAITLNRYVHCSMELKRENMKKLEEIQI